MSLTSLRYALRLFVKDPRFSLLATCTLALGIGANTAIFGVVDALHVRLLPYPGLVLAGTVGVVLIVSCVNVATLLLARSQALRRDVAIRTALGANRGQIISEIVVRGFLLGIVAGAVGLIVGLWIRDLLVARAPGTILRVNDVGLSPAALIVTGVTSMFAGSVAGLVPAFQVAGTTRAELSGLSTTLTARPAVVRWRGALVAVEVAVAVTLTAGAGLLLRSLAPLNSGSEVLGLQAEPRFYFVLLASSAVLAGGLALVGCYSVAAAAAAQRTREIGIRLAVGAPERSVVRLVIAGTLQWSLTGVAVGLAGAVALGREMKGLLAGVGPADPLTLLPVGFGTIGLVVLASYVPARRAAAVDPGTTLRVE